MEFPRRCDAERRGLGVSLVTRSNRRRGGAVRRVSTLVVLGAVAVVFVYFRFLLG